MTASVGGRGGRKRERKRRRNRKEGGERHLEDTKGNKKQLNPTPNILIYTDSFSSSLISFIRFHFLHSSLFILFFYLHHHASKLVTGERNQRIRKMMNYGMSALFT